MIPIRTTVETGEFPGAVIGLIIANVAVFLVQSGLPADLAGQFVDQNALIPARYTDPGLAARKGLDPGNYLPFLTNTFMHAGWFHLAVNMWTLWLLGRPLEQRLGAGRFVLVYLVCGIIASLFHFAFNFDSPLPALGASGSVAGVLGGFTLLYPRARILVLTPVLFFPVVFRLLAVVYTAIWFAFQIVSGTVELYSPETVGGIAWWAHIGGFLAGIALVLVAGGPRRGPKEIGQAPTGMREIGDRRPRILRVGPKTRGARATAAPAPRKKKPDPPPARSRPAARGGWVASDVDFDVTLPDPSGETPPDPEPRRRGPWG